MSEERLVRVERFEEVDIGVLTVTFDCESCGRSRCPGMIFKKITCHDPGYTHHGKPGFLTLPPCPGETEFEEVVLTAEDVATGDVYRVITDEPKSQETKRTRVKERAR